jgi:hypothetical protein
MISSSKQFYILFQGYGDIKGDLCFRLQPFFKTISNHSATLHKIGVLLPTPKNLRVMPYDFYRKNIRQMQGATETLRPAAISGNAPKTMERNFQPQPQPQPSLVDYLDTSTCRTAESSSSMHPA